MSKGTIKFSGLQKEVLRLYKTFHKELKKKPPGESRDNLTNFVRKTFKERASQVSKRDIQRVEYFINLGKKQLKTLTMSGTDGFTFFENKEKSS